MGIGDFRQSPWGRGLPGAIIAGAGILAPLFWPGLSSAYAADSRCPIVMLAPLSGSTPVSVIRELPDNQVMLAGKAAGSQGRDALAEDFDEAKLAPFWDQGKWMEANSFALTSAGVKSGYRALLLTVHQGDKEQYIEDFATGYRRCTERAELGEAEAYWPKLGDDLWYGFAVNLPATLPVIDRRLVLAQIKQAGKKATDAVQGNADGYPVLALRLRQIKASNTLCLYLTAGNDIINDRNKPLAIVQLNRDQTVGSWHNIVLHARLSHGKSTESAADWWFDDQPVPHLTTKPIAIGYKQGGDFSYFKLGLYRDQAIRGSGEVDQDWTIAYDAIKRAVDFPGRDGPAIDQQSVSPAAIDPPLSLLETSACRAALGVASLK